MPPKRSERAQKSVEQESRVLLAIKLLKMKNWPTQYIKRHPELTTRFSRKYDYHRALMEDPNTIIE